MKLYSQISKKQAVGFAKELVVEAKKEIIATMNVDEEYSHPLPESYHDLLAKKAGGGINVTRYGFGSLRVFKTLQQYYPAIRFLYAGKIDSYQRMLIVDKKRGMFALDSKIFYTDFAPLALHFVKYIEIVYNKEVV
ncbi:MAG: hypothetical protein ABH856_03340 [Patescibacteria group bacterium]